jgi:capsular polysaccharide biosynthesis protein
MIEPPDPTVESFDDVTLLPCRRDPHSPTGHSFGAFDRNGAHIPAFAHPWCTLRPEKPGAHRHPGRFVYGGVLMDHFGHFLLEAMARLWFIRAHPELPVLWHEIDLPVPHAPWPGWRQEAWSLLGLAQHRHHVIRRPMRFEHVVVPQPGFSTAQGLHPLQAAALAVVPTPTPTPHSGERVWLSRGALPEQFGRLLGEATLERHLAERGWTVLRPETLGVAVQVNVFAGAAMVAGFAGSAFHAVLLCAAPRARLCILRRPAIRTVHYDHVAQARGLDLTHLEVPLRPTGPLNAWTTFEIADPKAAADAIFAATA